MLHSLSCVTRNETRMSHRHRIDKYLDRLPYLPTKHLGRWNHRPLPKGVSARWLTARVIISLILPNQSQRSSFAVIQRSWLKLLQVSLPVLPLWIGTIIKILSCAVFTVAGCEATTHQMINLSCLPRVPTTEALRLAAFAAPDSVDISISDATRSVALDPAQNISPSYSSLLFTNKVAWL